ncbi:MAG: 3-oxoadipate enol-lactonase [Acidobacteriota bacterium]|nr:3-oxoadipate enol-lactonase [Acidobacteriota bacterium]
MGHAQRAPDADRLGAGLARGSARAPAGRHRGDAEQPGRAGSGGGERRGRAAVAAAAGRRGPTGRAGAGGGARLSTTILHHEASGPEHAPVVLLANSLGANLSMWQPQVAALARSFRVITFDQRGHGASPIPPGPYAMSDLGEDVIALLDRLGVERASYVGLSIGGMAGIWLGANAPERLDRLVLMCTSAHAPPASRWRERVAAVRAAGTTASIADAVVARWFTPSWSLAHPDAVAAHRAMIAGTDPDGYCGCCEAIAEMDLRDALPRIPVPTLVLGGADDLALPPEHQRLIAAAIPGARLELIADAAHIASAEQPATVNRLIEEHLAHE